MSVPYTFATATGSIPLSQLDANFATGVTIGNTSVQLGGTITNLNNMSLANVAITSVNTLFPNGYLANSNVVLGTTTITLGSTVTSVDGLTLSNVTISSGNVTISNVSVSNFSATTANVSGTANVSNLVVIGNATVGGNVSAAKGTFTSANVSGTANVQIIAVTQDATVAGNITATGNITGAKGTFTSANITGTSNISSIQLGGVVTPFPNNFLANSSVIIGNTTVALGSTASTVGNVTVSNTTVTLYTESVVAIGNSSTSKTLDLTSGTFQTVTMTGNCTFTMPTATAGRSFILIVSTGAGSFTGTFTSVKWPSNTAPTLTTTASRWDILSFFSDGTNWYGNYVQAFQ